MDKKQLLNEIDNILKAIGIWKDDGKNKYIADGIITHYITLNEIGVLDKMTEEERMKDIHTYGYGYVCGYMNGKRDGINTNNEEFVANNKWLEGD